MKLVYYEVMELVISYDGELLMYRWDKDYDLKWEAMNEFMLNCLCGW